VYKRLHDCVAFGNLYRYVKSLLLRYPAPSSLGYFWNYGSLAGLYLVVQIISGLFLVMFYTPSTEGAFASIEHIMRDINYGWLLRYIHANGASFFFFVIYLHMFRGIYYGSYQYPRNHVWFAGVAIYLLLMATAFLGCLTLGPDEFLGCYSHY
jgi:quinol-cytochrome oxidoreductase complex cytochrome b subunit